MPFMAQRREESVHKERKYYGSSIGGRMVCNALRFRLNMLQRLQR